MSNYHIMNPTLAGEEVGNRVRILALQHKNAKKQIYIAVKSNYSKWFVDQKTTREDGYYTPDEWLNIWIGIN